MRIITGKFSNYEEGKPLLNFQLYLAPFKIDIRGKIRMPDPSEQSLQPVQNNLLIHYTLPVSVHKPREHGLHPVQNNPFSAIDLLVTLPAIRQNRVRFSHMRVNSEYV